MRVIKIAVVCFLVTLGLLYWASTVIADPSDECNDSSISATARFISCTIERR